MNITDDRLTQEFPDLIRGDNYPIEVEFLDDNEEPLDVSGKTLYVTFKESPDQPDDEALLQVSWLMTGGDPEGGIFITALSPTQTLKLPTGRLWVDYKLIGGEHVASTIVGGRISVRNTATWATGPDETPPELYVPAFVVLPAAAGTGGLPHDDPALVAVMNAFVAIDNRNGQVPVTVDLTGLADPIPVGEHQVPVTAEDDAGNVATGQFELEVLAS